MKLNQLAGQLHLLDLANNMLRVRFHANADDYRPISWPVKHPYWCSGYGGDYAVVISYADSEEYSLVHWPDATNLDAEECNEYTFTSRFPRPDWFTESEYPMRNI